MATKSTCFNECIEIKQEIPEFTALLNKKDFILHQSIIQEENLAV